VKLLFTFNTDFAVGNLQLSVGKLQLTAPDFLTRVRRCHAVVNGFCSMRSFVFSWLQNDELMMMMKVDGNHEGGGLGSTWPHICS